MFFVKYHIIKKIKGGYLMDNLNRLQKSSLKQLKISDMNIEKPDLKGINTTKANAVYQWLKSWILAFKDSKNFNHNILLPTKPELAYFLGVSVGTVQNALRYLEDSNLVVSKQGIGTIVGNFAKEDRCIRKLSSKRDSAINTIINYITENNYKSGQELPSSRVISSVTGCSLNTTRLAMEYLGSKGILCHTEENTNKSGWRVSNIENTNKISVSIVQETLVDKIAKDLKVYINDNFKIGDKIPAHAELVERFNVSMKTIHDGLTRLINEGILLPRRGHYGTTVIKMPYSMDTDANRETSIFASAKETEFYYYEKTQNHIKQMIAQNYEIGQKLPSILELSKELDLSPNTIRKAFHNLAKEGYLAFSRGRYGGTFVIDIPEISEGTFKWLAVNPKYAEIYNN